MFVFFYILPIELFYVLLNHYYYFFASIWNKILRKNNVHNLNECITSDGCFFWTQKPSLCSLHSAAFYISSYLNKRKYKKIGIFINGSSFWNWMFKLIMEHLSNQDSKNWASCAPGQSELFAIFQHFEMVLHLFAKNIVNEIHQRSHILWRITVWIIHCSKSNRHTEMSHFFESIFDAPNQMRDKNKLLPIIDKSPKAGSLRNRIQNSNTASIFSVQFFQIVDNSL